MIMSRLAAEKQPCALTGAENVGCDEESKKLSSSSWKSHNLKLLESHIYGKK
jgi:hypothetical protein